VKLVYCPLMDWCNILYSKEKIGRSARFLCIKCNTASDNGTCVSFIISLFLDANLKDRFENMKC